MNFPIFIRKYEHLSCYEKPQYYIADVEHRLICGDMTIEDAERIYFCLQFCGEASLEVLKVIRIDHRSYLNLYANLAELQEQNQLLKQSSVVDLPESFKSSFWKRAGVFFKTAYSYLIS